MNVNRICWSSDCVSGTMSRDFSVYYSTHMLWVYLYGYAGHRYSVGLHILPWSGDLLCMRECIVV